jgi:hypothetical protein
MQVSKFLLTVCAATVCAGFISVHAQDNPAQAAARAALMDKMNELEPSPASTNAETPPIIVTPSGVAMEPQNPPAAIPTPPPAPPEPPPAPTVPAMMPAPAVAPIQTPEPAATMAPPTDNSNPVAPASSDNAAQAAARTALEQKMSETPEQPAAVTPIETPAPAATMPTTTEPAPSPAPPVVPATMPATNAIAAQPPVKPALSKPAPPASVKQAGNEPGFKPIVAPPLPISMTKEEQLQALLDKYKADQITPEEYFKQRAAILAEPDATAH